MVVGSIGPFGAHLLGGAEYNGDYAETISAEVCFTLLNLSFDAHADIFLISFLAANIIL